MATRTRKKMVPGTATSEWSLERWESMLVQRDIQDSILNCLGSHGEVLS